MSFREHNKQTCRLLLHTISFVLCAQEKLQKSFLKKTLVRPGEGLNQQTTTIEADAVTITSLAQLLHVQIDLKANQLKINPA